MERAILPSEGTTLRRSAAAFLPRFTVEPGARRPLYLQVRDFLRQAIVSGDLAPGARLPSTRRLATQLGASRNTVLNAYEALAAEGLIGGKAGSGTRVAGGVPRPKPRDFEFLLRHSHYPAGAVALRDPEGNPLYFHR
jgi:DNA-binding transcriptional regulator YhcF (GntR family)